MNEGTPSPAPLKTAQQPPSNPTPPSRRRYKPQLSCTSCRTRKLRCDRLSPCQNCSRRGLAGTCTYVTPNPQNTARAPRTLTNLELQDKVRHLENLVSTYIASQSNQQSVKQTGSVDSGIPEKSAFGEAALSSPNSIDEDVSQVAESVGRIEISNEEANYIGNTHWKSLLNELSEVTQQLEDANQSDLSDPNDDEGPDLLLGQREYINRASILRFIPSKADGDLLISTFLRSTDAAMIIHRPTFLKEYAQFCEDPSSVSTSWLALLFGVFSIALSFLSLSQQPLPAYFHQPANMVAIYREKAAQCLILANYTRSAPHTVEALIIYTATEAFRSMEVSFGISVLNSILVHTAMRMGYHRDGSHYSDLSVFQAEMRRRVWAGVRNMDFLVNSMTGLPNLIKTDQTDTAPPHNLQDEDFDENSIVLPPERPHDPHFRLAFNVIKLRGLAIFRKIDEFVDSTTAHPYSEVLRLDKTLADCFDWSSRFWDDTDPDPASEVRNLTLRKYYLRCAQLKSRIVLHRKYLVPALTNPQYEISRKACVESAVLLLSSQLQILEFCKPGGISFADAWTVSLLTGYNVLLAMVVLSVEMTRGSGATHTFCGLEDNEPRTWINEDFLKLMETARDTWALQMSESSGKVVRVIESLLEKVRDYMVESGRIPGPVESSLSSLDSQFFSPLETNPGSTVTVDMDFEPFLEKSSLDALGSFNQTFDLNWHDWDTEFRSQKFNDMTGLFYNIHNDEKDSSIGNMTLQ